MWTFGLRIMVQTTILLDREDTSKVEAEERNRWIKNVLLKIGIPLDDAWPDENITVEQKIKLRKLLNKYDVIILDDGDRGTEIYVDKEIIARWNKPTYKLKTDNGQIDPSKKLFLEMTTDAVSIFDNDGDQAE